MRKTNGLFAARGLIKRRKKGQMLKKGYISKVLGIAKRRDPLEGAHQAKGTVIEKVGIEERKPNSGLRKCVRVKLRKNKKTITAFVPGDGTLRSVSEHDTVLIERIGGAKGRSRGDLPGVRWQVIKIGDKSIHQLLYGLKGRRHKKV